MLLPDPIHANVDDCSLTITDNPFDRLPMKREFFPNESEEKSFIKHCVISIRRSIEYKEWRKYISDSLDVRCCLFTRESDDDVTIEIHHHPYTLFDLVQIIVNTNVENKCKFSTFDISQQVMELHYTNRIGYVPLATTLHEKFHSGNLWIPHTFVLGNWKYICDAGILTVDPEIVAKVNRYMNDNLNVDPKTFTYNKWSKGMYPGIQQD